MTVKEHVAQQDTEGANGARGTSAQVIAIMSPRPPVRPPLTWWWHLSAHVGVISFGDLFEDVEGLGLECTQQSFADIRAWSLTIEVADSYLYEPYIFNMYIRRGRLPNTDTEGGCSLIISQRPTYGKPVASPRLPVPLGFC